MNVQPKSGPEVIKPVTASPGNQGNDARARAIAAYESAGQPTAQTPPVRNPSQVSPEEFTAIQAKYRGEQTQTPPSPTPEEAAAKAAPVDTKDPALSSKYAQLARKEKELRIKAQRSRDAQLQREAALNAKEEAFKQREAEYQSKYIDKARIAQDPLGVMSEAGLTYEQLTAKLLNTPTPENAEQSRAFAKLENELAEVRKTLADAKTEADKQQKASYDQALVQIRSDVTRMVSTDPRFEVIKEMKQVNEVVRLIEKTYQEDGVVLDIEDAAQEIENELVNRAVKTSNINKIRNRLQANSGVSNTQVKTQAAPVTKPQSTSQSQPKTLTNAVSGSKPLSRRERAILAAQGLLR